MEITNMSLTNYAWAKPEGSLSLTDGATNVTIRLTEDEARELAAMAYTFFERRQQALAKDIANAKPALLAGPSVDGEFTEVDNVPF